MASCGVCGEKFSSRVIGGICFCDDCFQKLTRLRSGDSALIDYYLTSKTSTCSTPAASQYMYDQAMLQKPKLDADRAYQEQKRQAEAEEHKKQEFANSFGEFYEYNVITAVNTIDGHTDAEKLKGIIQAQAKMGWKLHTVYSNELGKNAISILGIGVNSTACEDVMIFERRVDTQQ